jgi:hypothetical protein
MHHAWYTEVRRTARRLIMIGCVAVVAGLSSTTLGCGGGDHTETEAEQTACERLRDHLVELRLADASGVDLAAHREAMRSALGEGFIAGCQSMPEQQIECALDAPDLETAASCTSH